MIRISCLPLCLFVATAPAGCGNGNGGPDPDAGFKPYEPPPLDTPYVDRVYLQEFNHATNELLPGACALVWVGLPPVSLADAYETPTQVTARGLEGVTIPEPDPDLVGAAFAPDGLVLAGPGCLYFHGSAGLQAVEAPAGMTITGLAPGAGQIYLLTDQGLGVAVDSGVVRWSATGAPVTAALEAGGDLYVAGADFVAAYPVPVGELPAGERWRINVSSGPVAALVAGVELPRALDLVVVGEQGLQGFDLAGASPAPVDVPVFAAGRVPLGEPVAATRTSDGGFTVATRGGVMRIMERGIGPEWRVYNAERWLPDEDVRTVATNPAVADGPLWFATAGGLASVTSERMTLEQKLEAFVERILLRHDRDGAVADSHLTVRGDLATNIPWDSDNDGGWTCYWILAECFRYQVTGDPVALAHFDASLERMLSLRTLTGTEHFLARAVIRKEGCILDDCDDPDDGEWFTSPDGEWWVKGDTSNDEVTSHMFMMGHAYDLCANEAQREGIRAHVDSIVGGLVDNDFQLIDLDGEVTSHGQLDPGYVNNPLLGQYADGGRRSVQMLAALTLAHYLTSDERYLEAKRTLISEHHYDENAIHESDAPFRQGEKSGDGNELATQGFFVLLRYEPDPALRAKWLDGWNRSYAHMRPQRGAWWDLTNAVVGGDDPDATWAGRWLQLAPVDMIRWTQHNSHRRDLAPAPDFYSDDARQRSDGIPLPYDERRCDRWNKDQYRVDGGMDGWIEMDAADVLAPYWMGRYYGFIIPED